MGKIGLHEKINRLPIQFENEAVLNCFLGIIKEFNNKKIDDPFVILKKQELWKIAGFKDHYREEEFRELVKFLTKSSTYKVKEGASLSGSIFITKIIDETEEIQIEIPQTFRPYIFTRKDILIMNKVKNKEKMEVQELDYWDRELKEKKKELFLLEEAEAFGIRGKYAKRLYMLLMQFKKTGYFCMSIDDFREVLEIPSSYTIGKMNDTVVKRAKKELEDKGIFTFKDNSKGKGRRKIEKIEISFELNTKIEEKKSVKKSAKEDLKEIISEIPKQKEIQEEKKEKIKVTLAEYEEVKKDYLKEAQVTGDKIPPHIKRALTRHMNNYEVIGEEIQTDFHMHEEVKKDDMDLFKSELKELAEKKGISIKTLLLKMFENL